MTRMNPLLEEGDRRLKSPLEWIARVAKELIQRVVVHVLTENPDRIVGFDLS